jgi:DNA-directed RNA polymerase specialized sigma24 family protein
MSEHPPSVPDDQGPHPTEKEPTIDAELLRRLAAGDPRASAAFLAVVHDRACRLVQDALAGPADRRPAAVERLIRAYRRDELQIQAALLSAQTSFRRHLLDLSQSAEVKDDRDYVTALISLTYNRWQRQHYGDKRAHRQAAAGSGGNGDGDSATARLTRAVDPRPGPDHRPMLDDFYEKLVEEIHLLCSGLKAGEPEIVYLRLFQGMTYEQIAREVGKSTASTYRVCQQVVAHLRRRFRDSAP